jgi:hypothetical protein
MLASGHSSIDNLLYFIQKKFLYPQRDERSSRGTTLISRSNAYRPFARLGREECRLAGSLLLHRTAKQEIQPALVDVSLSVNGEVPAGSTVSSASGSGVIFYSRSGSGFTNPGLSLPGNAVYLLPLCLRIFFYDTREKLF